MNKMEVFNNQEFGSVRIMQEGDKYLFCGKDIAEALGYKDTINAIKQHCRWVVKHHVPHPQNPMKQIEMAFIPEGDVYRLITHSKLPGAERFEKWVFDEVLPTIRKYGAYITDEKLWEIATSPEALHKLTGDLLAARKENAELLQTNHYLQKKADFFDFFIDMNAATNIRETAKELEVSERKLVRFLQDAQFAYRAPAGYLLPYTKPSNKGLFAVKDYCRNGHIGSYMLITPKGKMVLRELRELILEIS